MLDSIMKKKSLRKLSSQRLGFLMVMVVSVWGMYLLSATKFRNDLKESDYLKSEIIKLSRQYLDALAKEKVSSNIGKLFSNIYFVFTLFSIVLVFKPWFFEISLLLTSDQLTRRYFVQVTRDNFCA